jgi:hypothetical protein
MSVFRRRVAQLDPELVDPTELTAAFSRTFLDDLEALCDRMATVDERLTALEQRLVAAEGAADMVPQHGDVLDVQVRAAKLAAEVHLLRMELGQLDLTER